MEQVQTSVSLVSLPKCPLGLCPAEKTLLSSAVLVRTGLAEDLTDLKKGLDKLDIM